MGAKKKSPSVFSFKGTVVVDGVVSEYGYQAETYATSKRKAENNLRFRYRQDHNLTKGAKIEFYGNFKEDADGC